MASHRGMYVRDWRLGGDSRATFRPSIEIGVTVDSAWEIQMLVRNAVFV
jgi:hypothetical protein